MLWRPQDRIMGMLRQKVISLKAQRLIDMVFFMTPTVAQTGNIFKKKYALLSPK